MTKYTDDIFNDLCRHVAEGGSLAQFGRETHIAVWRLLEWINGSDERGAKYARAREASSDKLASEIVEIADSEGDPAVVRNRIEARKWVAAKLKPKVYGDRIQAEVNATITLEQLVLQAIEPPKPEPTTIEGKVEEE